MATSLPDDPDASADGSRAARHPRKSKVPAPLRKPHDINFAKIDLNLLKVFDSIMQEKNLTRAAERLNKSVAATSHALGRLRKQLNDNLFDTPGRGMIPTRRANEIAPTIRACLGQLKQGITAEPMFDPATASRTFVIDIPVGGDLVIAPALAIYAAEHAPLVEIRISSDRAAVLINELRYGETELAIDHEPVEGDGLRHEPLYNDEFFLISRQNHPEIPRRGGISAELYGKLKHVGVSWTRTRGDGPMANRLTRAGIERTFRMMVPTLGSVPPIVESTDLVCAMSERVVKNFTRRWKLEMHPLAFHMEPIPLYLVWHQRFDGDPGHAWLRGAVRAACDAI